SRPLLDILKDLRPALEGSGGAAKNAAEIFDTRAIVAILNYSEKSDELAEAPRNSTGAAREYAETFLDDNLAAAQRELAKATEDLAQTFAGTFANDIADVTAAIAGFFRTVDRWMSRFEEISFADWYEREFGTVFRSQDRQRAEELLETIEELDRQARSLQAFLEGKPADLTGIAGLPAGPVTDANRSWVENLLARIREDAAAARQELIDLQKAGELLRRDSEGGDSEAAPGQPSPSAARDVRTIADVYADLAEGIRDADRVAEAFGNTTEASLDAAQTKARLTERAINELLTSFDVDPANAELQALIVGLEALGVEIETLKSVVPLTSGASAEFIEFLTPTPEQVQ